MLAKCIWHKVLEFDYEPLPATKFEIPKPSGGTRTIMAFSIPDAALANIIMRRARDRNLKRLSPHSYAYHPKKNVFDAILAISNCVGEEKLFAIQIDFEKYFDSIPTRHLRKCIEDKEVLSLTPHERHIFTEFLTHKYAPVENYSVANAVRRVCGTPQGSSASLLLANVANNSLDRSIESEAGKFVRFADDVLAICNSHDQAEKLESRFVEHCERSGLIINEKKSPGLLIIARHKAEMNFAQGFEYLGYRFTKDGLTIPEVVIGRIKRKISRLIHIYLVHYPNKFGFNPNRVGINPNFDWDLLGLVTEVRKYLYGGLDEQDIRAFLDRGARLKSMRGLMGFYALLEQKSPLATLDGWLTNSIKRALRKRNTILNSRYNINGLSPDEESLIVGDWLDIQAWRGNDYPEAGLPSFVRGWRAARKHYYTFGLENVEPPSYISYY